jgi:hypothetical protein
MIFSNLYIFVKKQDMKKLAFALLFLAGMAALSSCDKDRCPQHGELNTPHHQAQRV